MPVRKNLSVRKNSRPQRRSYSNLSFERLEPRRVLASLLVNFEDFTNRVEFVSTADFAAADPNVDANAPVNSLGTQGGGVVGSDGLVANISIDGGPGLYVDQPILDSYLFNRSSEDFDTVTVSSLEELQGSITLVIYGVGDQTDQESEFQVIYNGVNLGSQVTDYDGATI